MNLYQAYTLSNFTDENRLNTLFYDYENDAGIFDSPAFADMPWSDGVDSLSLNVAYFGTFSGFKRPSPYLIQKAVQNEIVNDNRPYIPQTQRYTVATILALRFKRKWQDLWNAYIAEIPIMDEFKEVLSATKSGTESGTQSGSTIRTGGETNAESGATNLIHGHTVTNTPTGTETRRKDYSGSEAITKSGSETKTQNSSGQGDVYGFNSTTKVPNTASSATETDTVSFENRKDETSYTGRYDTESLTFTTRQDLQTNAGTDSTQHGKTVTTTYDSVTDTDSSTTSGTSSSLVDQTKSGHNQSRAELIRQYLDVFQIDYFRAVFRDIDSVIALSVY